MASTYTLDEIGLGDVIWDTLTRRRCPEPRCDGPAGHVGPHRHFPEPGIHRFETWGH